MGVTRRPACCLGEVGEVGWGGGCPSVRVSDVLLNAYMGLLVVVLGVVAADDVAVLAGGLAECSPCPSARDEGTVSGRRFCVFGTDCEASCISCWCNSPGYGECLWGCRKGNGSCEIDA